MGLTLQFACGKAVDILRAVDNDDFDYIERLEADEKLADFSLHIEPKDLDTLVQVISAEKNIQVSGIREYLLFDGATVDEVDKGAVKVMSTITRLFAALPEEHAASIAQGWYKEMAKAYPSELIEYTEDAAESVRQMIMVCKRAIEDNEDLVHVWFL